MIISLEDAKNYLRVDDDITEDDALITDLITAAEEYIFAATGFEYGADNKRAALLCRVLVTDWYENRELTERSYSSDRSVSSRYRRICDSILVQLKYGDST